MVTVGPCRNSDAEYILPRNLKRGIYNTAETATMQYGPLPTYTAAGRLRRSRSLRR